MPTDLYQDMETLNTFTKTVLTQKNLSSSNSKTIVLSLPSNETK